MPGGDLPRLAEVERPAPAAVPPVSGPLPGTFVPTGGFAQFASQLAAARHPAPLKSPSIRRNLASVLMLAGVMLEALVFLSLWPIVRDVERLGLTAPTSFDDQLLRLPATLLVAFACTIIAAGLALAVWWYTTVNRAVTRYPRLGVSPLAAVLWHIVPIFSLWHPWGHLRRAGRCEDGTTPRCVDAWHLMVIFRLLAVNLPMGWIVDLKSMSELSQFTILASIVVAYDVVLAFVALVAMHATDMATSGLEYADSVTPAPATA